MKKIFLVWLLLSSLSSFSQQKGVYVLKRPIKYLNNNNGTIENSNAERDDLENWVVASDRENNPTFKNENGTELHKTMNFLECFWVTEDKGDFVHLYKLDPNEFQLEEGSSRKKGKQAKLIKQNDYGWAPKSSLLLWFRAVVNERQLTKRALPVLRFESINDENIKVKDGVIQLYKNPRLSVQSDKQVRMFQFLYIYKEDIANNSILVGLSYKTADRQIQNDVLGWVHKGILQSWGDRICLEPNWDDNAVAKRKSLNTKAAIFTSLDDAKAFRSGNTAKANDAEWNNDTYSNRMHPNEKRFPILSSETGVDGIVKTGFVTALLDGDNKIVASSAENAITVREGNLNILEKRKVNLIIAVDGSSGMEEYIDAAKLAIAQIKERVERKNSEDQDLDDEDLFKYRYGAVVYRNIEDRNCSEDLSVETTPLSTDAGNVINFLATRSKKSSCNPGEKKNGALYSGLQGALRMFQEVENFNKETNVLILIGGKSGMATNGLSDEKISDLMVKTNTHLMCFQVKTNQDEAFQSFPNKMVGIFELARTKYNQSKPDDLYTSQFKPFGERCYKLDYPEGSIVQGILAYSSLTDFFSTNAIYEKVDSLMKNTEQKLETDIQVLSTKINGVGNKKIKMNAVVANFLAQLGKQVRDKDIIKKYRGNNYQFFIPGYTSLTTNSITEEDGIYKKVLYLTTEELTEMTKSIGELNMTGSGAEVRKKLKNAFRQILINYLGDRGANNAIKNNDNLDYVVRLVTGLPTNNSFLKSHKIDDFDNTQKMSDTEVLNLQKSFAASFTKLTKALSDDELIETEPWGKFYWIAEDLLPQ